MRADSASPRRRVAPASPISAMALLIGSVLLRATASANSCSAVASSPWRARSAPSRMSHSGTRFAQAGHPETLRAVARRRRRLPPDHLAPRPRRPACRGFRATRNCSPIAWNPSTEARTAASARVEIAHQRQISGGEQVVGGQPPAVAERGENRVRLGQHDGGRGDVAVAVEQLAEDQQRITQALRDRIRRAGPRSPGAPRPARPLAP